VIEKVNKKFVTVLALYLKN